MRDLAEVRHISKIYNPGTVHENVFGSLRWRLPGLLFFVVGSNGSGKDQPLNILCGSFP